MGNVRPVSEKKYGLSKHKFLQMYHFCLQYNEWKDELQYKSDTVKCIEISDVPKGSGGTGNATEDLAIRRAMLSKNCELVEQTCIEADEGIYQWILKAVTNEGIGYTYLKERMDIPCSRNTYYERRRKFYWLLSKKI